MVTFKKFKYVIFSLLAIAVIASATAFSVSYAKWAAPTTDSVNANLSTGNWDKPVTDIRSQYSNGFLIIGSDGNYTDNEITFNADDEYSNGDYYKSFIINITDENCRVKLFINDKHINFDIIKDTSFTKNDDGSYSVSKGKYECIVSEQDGMQVINFIEIH